MSRGSCARPASEHTMASQIEILLTFLFCHVPSKRRGTSVWKEGGVDGFGQKRTLQFLMLLVQLH